MEYVYVVPSGEKISRCYDYNNISGRIIEIVKGKKYYYLSDGNDVWGMALRNKDLDQAFFEKNWEFFQKYNV